MGNKYDPINLFIEAYNCDFWFEDEKSSDTTKTGVKSTELPRDEEEVKEEKGLKILTSNKLLTRLPILLAKIKAGNNSYKV